MNIVCFILDKHVDYREDHGMIGEDYIMGDMD